MEARASGDKSVQVRSVVSFVEMSSRSVRLLVARCLPRGIKETLKAGPLRVVIDALDHMEGRVFSQGLAPNAVFDVSAEYSAASASMSIIVPIHDAPSVTARCLESLERNAEASEVILVDDASQLQETIQLIEQFRSRNGWKVVRHNEPRGHSAACSAGAGLASRPYLCLLNSDTVVTPWCWRPIQEAFENDSSIGAAGPCTSHSGGNEQTVPIAFKCRFSWNDSQIYGFARRLVDPTSQPAICDLPWIAGFAFFIRRGLWKELGGFDQHLRDYSNEVELCTRITKSGRRIVWVKNAYIHHFGAQSYGKLMTAPEIKTRNFAGLQYIREKHNLQHPATDK